MTNEYCSYEDLEEYQNLNASGALTLDADKINELRIFCEIASRMFDASARRVFYPTYETRYYDQPEQRDYGISVLWLDRDLLEVDTLKTDNGDDTVAAGDYFPKQGNSYSDTPYNKIELNEDGDNPTFNYSTTPQKSQQVTGWWGYHDDWDNAWVDSGDSVQNAGGLTAGATSLEVNDADGDDEFGIAPRFKVQQLLKIEDEYIYITDKNTTTDALTVVRGRNGTTAAAHAVNTTIYVYKPMRDIFNAARRLSAWLYSQKDAPMTKTINALAQGTTIEIPQEAPIDVQAVAAMYRKHW